MNISEKFIKSIEKEAEVKEQLNEQQIELLKKKASEYKNPMLNEKIFMTVVYIVGGALLLSIIAAVIMAFPTYSEVIDPITELAARELIEKEVPEIFVVIASASIGALAGLLVPSPTGN